VVLVVESEVAELAEAAVSLSFSPELSLENLKVSSKFHKFPNPQCIAMLQQCYEAMRIQAAVRQSQQHITNYVPCKLPKIHPH